uniref:Uncharacterized protein n=1 Tax=Romanomermis culicivorax TaxID=13658 RepID=A0A915L5M5_ROMCU
MTGPPDGWIWWRMPTFGDSGAVADWNRDALMMLTSSLTECSVSSTAVASTVGELVVAAGGNC